MDSDDHDDDAFDDDQENGKDGNDRVIVSDHPSLRQRLRGESENQRSALLQSLIDETMHSTRRSELLESQTAIAEGPIGDMIMKRERERQRTVHRYEKRRFDCPKFQHDVYEVRLLLPIQVRLYVARSIK